MGKLWGNLYPAQRSKYEISARGSYTPQGALRASLWCVIALHALVFSCRFPLCCSIWVALLILSLRDLSISVNLREGWMLNAAFAGWLRDEMTCIINANNPQKRSPSKVQNCTYRKAYTSPVQNPASPDHEVWKLAHLGRSGAQYARNIHTNHMQKKSGWTLQKCFC